MKELWSDIMKKKTPGTCLCKDFKVDRKLFKFKCLNKKEAQKCKSMKEGATAHEIVYF